MSGPKKALESLNRKASTGVFWASIGHFGYRGFGFIIFIVLARLLTPDDFGLVALSFTYIAFIQVFLDPGFAEAIIQKEKISNVLISSAFWVNFLIGIALFFVSFCCSPMIAILFKNIDIVPVVQCLSPLFLVLGIVAVPTAVLRRDFEFKQLAIASLVGVFIGGVVGISAALLGAGVWALVSYQIVNKVIESLLIMRYCAWKPQFVYNHTDIMALLKFGVNITGSRIVTYLTRYGADLIIGVFLGTASAGYFNVAFRIVRTIVELVGSIVSKVYLALFSRLQQDKVNGRVALLHLIQQVSFLFFPLFAFLGILSPSIIIIVFGDKWIPVVPIMQILVVVGMVSIILYINDSVLIANGKPNWKFKIDTVNAIINISLLFYTAKISLTSVACGYTLRAFLLSPLSVVCVCVILQLPIMQFLKSTFPFILATVFMTLVIYFLQILLVGVGSFVLHSLLLFPIGLVVYYSILRIAFQETMKNLRLTLKTI